MQSSALQSGNERETLTCQAGGTIEIRDPSTVRKKLAPGGYSAAHARDIWLGADRIRSAEEPNKLLTGFADMFAPILKLPPFLSYPILILIFGGFSAIFLPLFGSGSIGSMTGR